MDDRKLSSTMQSAELTPFQKLKISSIENAIEESSKALANHKIYNAIETIEDLQIFMSHHIYCVWDFMNLIKVGFEFNPKKVFLTDNLIKIRSFKISLDMLIKFREFWDFLLRWIWSDVLYKLTFNVFKRSLPKCKSKEIDLKPESVCKSSSHAARYHFVQQETFLKSRFAAS